MKRLALVTVLCLLTCVSVSADEFADTKTKAEKGDAIAQYNLGLIYQKGQNVIHDYVEAAKWFHMAAVQGNASAQEMLAGMYFDGDGVTQDHAEAAKWYRKAAEQGNVYAQEMLADFLVKGTGVRQDIAEGAMWYRKAAMQGGLSAQLQLAYLYVDGVGVPQDDAEAIKWFNKAAEQGSKYAQVELGMMYYSGQGVPQNYVKALKWYRKAAENGVNSAQNNLGLMYGYGKGVTQNYAEAYVWLSIAALSGDEVTINNRDIYASKLSTKALGAAQQRATMLHREIQQGNTITFDSQPPSSLVPAEWVVKSSGTCFFIDSFGTAVTNNHVIDGFGKIEIIDSNGSKSSANILKVSSVLDVAVLTTGHQTPQFLTLAANGTLALGQDVFTIGFPVTNLLGDKPKYSEGTISALSGLNNDDSWIQMSTPIQPGNSGGPLVNKNGQVVGIVTATVAVEKFFAVTGSLPQNINWAIKAQYARALIPETLSKPQFRNKQDAISHTEKSVCRVIAN